MADPADTSVDEAIARLEEAVAALKSSQAKDDEKEGNDLPLERQPRTLSEARIRVREHFRARRAAAASGSEK